MKQEIGKIKKETRLADMLTVERVENGGYLPVFELTNKSIMEIADYLSKLDKINYKLNRKENTVTAPEKKLVEKLDNLIGSFDIDRIKIKDKYNLMVTDKGFDVLRKGYPMIRGYQNGNEYTEVNLEKEDIKNPLKSLYDLTADVYQKLQNNTHTNENQKRWR